MSIRFSGGITEASQPQLPASGPRGQPIESSHLAQESGRQVVAVSTAYLPVLQINYCPTQTGLQAVFFITLCADCWPWEAYSVVSGLASG
jgi:hypothetical protein